MYPMRSWSVRNARWLSVIYQGIEVVLKMAHPLMKRVGYERLDKPFVKVEKVTKGFLFDSQSCGQCIMSFTGLSCPMNCPKSIRNGPCGGVRANGMCEVNADMTCVWVLAWEGNKRMHKGEYPIQVVQPPVDDRLRGSSAWLRDIRQKVAQQGPTASGSFENS
ncbi:MAG: hypothetical protein GXP15_14830 [Gammaproteobacteria bacterium]|nr:hypothetical protein [Gammaproteobacteria bacterium]